MNLIEIREKLKTKPVLIASENFREETLAHRPGGYEFNTEADKLECVKSSQGEMSRSLRSGRYPQPGMFGSSGFRLTYRSCVYLMGIAAGAAIGICILRTGAFNDWLDPSSNFRVTGTSSPSASGLYKPISMT